MDTMEQIQRLLPPDCGLGRQIHHVQETGSTNADAKLLAAQGAVHGTVVLADRQSAGRGRLGKTFHSPQGGLYLSVIVRMPLPLSDMMAATACTASAVYVALAEFGVFPQIKWVNDLFLHDRKICGILCEGGFSPETGALAYIVVGIGLNLSPDPGLPPELSPIVTDIRTETGLELDRNAVTASILRHLDLFLLGLPERTFLDIYTTQSYTIGKQVIVSRNLSGNVSRETLGTAIGYTDDAGLIVRFPDGMEEVIRTGTARFPKENC